MPSSLAGPELHGRDRSLDIARTAGNHLLWACVYQFEARMHTCMLLTAALEV